MENTRLKKLNQRIAASILPLFLLVALAIQFLPSGEKQSSTEGEPSHSFGYGYSSPPPIEVICNDLIDNDGDTLVDCEDNPDCSLSVHCEETCDNEIDDDNDGAIDCDDLWCKEYDPACA
jgi:hypothetical protein